MSLAATDVRYRQLKRAACRELSRNGTLEIRSPKEVTGE